MLRAYTTEAVREAEAKVVAAAATDELMKQAARAVADKCIDAIAASGQTPAGSVVLALIGGGDNGGDGLYACAMLAEAGLEAKAVILSNKYHQRAYAAADKAGVELMLPDLDVMPSRLAKAIAKLSRSAGVWIDAMTGTGCTKRLRRPMRDVVRELERERELSPDEPIIVAVDVPSGVGGDDGAIAGPHLHATHTVTMAARKAASLLAPAMYSFGEVSIVDLKIAYPGTAAVSVLEAADVGDRLLVPQPDDHKYTRGVVQVIAGSETYPMTGVLCAGAAARCGAGMVRYLGPDEATLALVSRYPEIVPSSGRHQAVVMGPGVAVNDHFMIQQLQKAIRDAASSHTPAVLDAGALSLVGQLRANIGAHCVLTPHAGEAAELLTTLGAGARRGGITREEVMLEPVRCCIELAEQTGATVVLKGGQTVIYGPAEQLFVCNEAPAWTATAGAGDVLAGTIAACLAGQQANAEQYGGELSAASITETVAAGVWLHGHAARLAVGPGKPIIASDIITELPNSYAQALSAM